MVFLARGRDADQPAVIVLLDGDAEGVNARKELEAKYGGLYLSPFACRRPHEI
jgi:hypothetical protein